MHQEAQLGSDIELQRFEPTATTLGSTRIGNLDGKTTPFSAEVSHAQEQVTEVPESIAESQNRQNATALPPVDGGIEAWTFVAAAFVLEALVWGFGYSYGVFQDFYTHNPPFNTSSETAIAAVGTAGLAIQYLEVIFLIIAHERWPHITRPMTWAALALFSGSLFLSSFATKISHLIILQGILFGIGGSALYAPVIVWLSEWFVRRRSLAGSIIFGGSGVGGALFPVLVNVLLTKVGWRWTLRTCALIIAVCAGAALWFIKARIPVSRNQPGQVKPVNMKFLKTPLFLVVATTIFIQAIAYFPVALYMPTYTTALGLPIIDGTLVLAVFNIASVVGQIIFGYLCDRMPYARVMIFSGVGSALSAYLLWGFAHTLSLIFVFVVIFGGLSGGFSSIWPPASAEIAGMTS
ncbi:hypothetical protein BOTBODRAFT_101786 [Botryobasidium botryosum FD-172 SS1]|uniref:Major facilitator superfamily (MFS) profile domain-containing protein n=1 Tax=Botryobasidium botryosum (strain FD-172 SS1) TaxID=930990 RepID=A0A067N7E7_BOTB1|nr:hypothetical protein BOTBODRAFT_101786 [Botryobasidium botryosum FD-172 SS1]